VRLYEFHRGVYRWRYTDSDRVQTYLFQDFEPAPISDDGVRQSEQSGADALTVTAPFDLPVAQLYRGAPPAEEVGLIVRDMHYGDAEAPIRFLGAIEGVRWPSPERAMLTCRSLAASLKRAGLRLAWERGCTHSLYDRNCTVDRNSFATPGAVTTKTGTTIEAAAWDALADGYFSGGYVEWDVGLGGTDRRGIEGHVGGVLTLLGGTDGIDVGMTVTAYAGCARTISVCTSKFSNSDNYGGIPHMPGKSPFDGTPVF
jgi:uncharacterized phage protein (TIGR02218 family)